MPKTLVTCFECNKEISLDDITSIDGEDYCEDCVVKHFRPCSRCNSYHRKEYLQLVEDCYFYCDYCRDEYATYCENCQRYVRNSSAIEIDGEDYCEDCVDNYFSQCEGCGDYVSNDISIRIYGDYYCEACFDQECFTCDVCGENRFLYEGADTDCGHVCEACRATRKHPATTFNRLPSWEWGIELETSFCDCEDEETCEEKTSFNVTEDGSISGLEFVSPICNGDSGLELVRKFCDYARGWKVDKNCGYHLHLNMRDCSKKEKDSIQFAYLHTADLWACFVSRHRLDNTFCKKLKKGDDCRDRYHWFNPLAYERHGTFEIRLHSATLNYVKIVNWITAHVLFVRYVKSLSFKKLEKFFGDTVTTQWEAMKKIWPTNLLVFYACRAGRFKPSEKCFKG